MYCHQLLKFFFLIFLPEAYNSTFDRVCVCIQDLEEGLRIRQQSRAWCWCMCLGLALILSGVVVGGAYLYRYYFIEVREPFPPAAPHENSE